MKHYLIESKDIYNNVYFSQQEINVEKLYDQLYGMIEPIEYIDIKSQDVFLLQLQTIEYLNSMEKRKHNKALKNLKILNNNSVENSDILLLNNALEKQANCKYIDAHQKYRELLNNNPKNRLAFFALHMMEFNLGWQKSMLETSQIVVNYLTNTNHSFYGYSKGIESFSLIENGFFEEAKDAAEIALRINPKDVYSIHAMCHYFYETGKYQEGILWMEKMKQHWHCNKGMRIHVWWHLAVFHLFNLDFKEVKQIMTNEIMCKNVENGFEDLDITALLWRLHLLDKIDIIPYKSLNNWDDYLNNSHFIFNDLHALIAYILKDEKEKIESLIQQVRERKYNTISYEQLNLLNGFYDFAKQNYSEAYKKLFPLLNNTNFGGSNAQRDIIPLTLYFSLLKSNNLDEARKLLDTCRAFKHPSKLKEQLLSYLEGDDH